MGTRQELGVLVLVLLLALVAAVDRPVPSGWLAPRAVGSRSAAEEMPVCPLQGPGMNGVRCVLLGMRIPINQAAASDLEIIPGIGPVLARRIVESRTRSGGFAHPDHLQRVPGIGPRRAGIISNYVCFSP